MPFAGYRDFDECVRKNSKKDNPKGYCATIQRKVEGPRGGRMREAEPGVEWSLSRVAQPWTEADLSDRDLAALRLELKMLDPMRPAGEDHS